ncbi:Arm DNA-binding domain-containing protein [Aliishimia ponticola]|nr:Arm DNA-binding domain-containing protein [Aliishimia ponticola]
MVGLVDFRMHPIPLSDAKLRNLKPKEKTYKVSDSGGLYVEVTKTGSLLWRLKYRFEGREKRLSFEAYPAVSLADARNAREGAMVKGRTASGKGTGQRRRAEAERILLVQSSHASLSTHGWQGPA